MNRILVLLALLFAASPALATDRVFLNPESNGDLRIKANVAGTPADAVLISGATGAVTLGASDSTTTATTLVQGVDTTNGTLHVKTNGASSQIKIERSGTSTGSVWIGSAGGDFRVGTAAGGTDILQITAGGTAILGPAAGGATQTIYGRNSASSPSLLLGSASTSTRQELRTYLDRTGVNVILDSATESGGGGFKFTANSAASTLFTIDSNGGVKFPNSGTSAGTVTATTLAFYEEGTCTPTVTGSSGAGGTVTYSTQACTYTRIGRALYISIEVLWTNWAGSPTGTLQVLGFPYPVKTGNNVPIFAVETNSLVHVAGAISEGCEAISGGSGCGMIINRDSANATGTNAASNAGATTRSIFLTGMYNI